MKLNYALDPKDYSIKNALSWGNFKNHAKKTRSGKWHSRVVHGLIATSQFFPLVSQVASLIELAAYKIFTSAKTQATTSSSKSCYQALDPLNDEEKARHAHTVIDKGLAIFKNPKNRCDSPFCGLKQFNAMAYLFLDTPEMHVSLHGGRINNERYDYEIPKDNKASLFLWPLF